MPQRVEGRGNADRGRRLAPFLAERIGAERTAIETGEDQRVGGQPARAKFHSLLGLTLPLLAQHGDDNVGQRDFTLSSSAFWRLETKAGGGFFERL